MQQSHSKSKQWSWSVAVDGRVVTTRRPIIYYFASATVAVDSSHMTASSSASWSRFCIDDNVIDLPWRNFLSLQFWDKVTEGSKLIFGHISILSKYGCTTGCKVYTPFLNQTRWIQTAGCTNSSICPVFSIQYRRVTNRRTDKQTTAAWAYTALKFLREMPLHYCGSKLLCGD